MNSNLQKQILIGGLVGILVMALTYIFLGGKRDELKSLEATNKTLQQDVDKGYSLKANAQKLEKQIAENQKYIDALIKIMPTDADRGEIPYRMKKLADTAGIDQVSFVVENPIKKTYYTEFPFTFTFKVGFHSFGQFTSLVSGYDKIINIYDMQFKRDTKSNGTFPATVACKISAFVYNPAEPPPPPPSTAPKPGPKAPAATQSQGD
jgi:type IV pilus assembly protein PilO